MNIANMKKEIYIKNEPQNEVWAMDGISQDTLGKNENKCSVIEEECMVSKATEGNSTKEKYLKMWNKIYPLVDFKQQINIYENNNGNISKTMAELRELNTRILKKEKPYQCMLCEKVFTQKSGLINHSKEHTGERPYQCSQCDIGFKAKSKLITHLRIHTGEKPYQCSQCGKGFRQKGHLTQHTKIHTGEKPYYCSYCDERFTQKNSLTIHKRKHTGDNL